VAKKPKLGRPPGSNSETTRARIVKAAQECFGRRGYALATNAEIAEVAGVTAGAIYKHFDSKHALFLAALRDAEAVLIPRYAEAAAGGGSVREKIEAIFRASATMFEDEPALTTFLSALPIEVSRHEEIADAIQIGEAEILARFQELFAGMKAEGTFAPELPPINVVYMFLASMMGLAQFGLAARDAEMADLIEPFIALIEGQIFSKQS